MRDLEDGEYLADTSCSVRTALGISTAFEVGRVMGEYRQEEMGGGAGPRVCFFNLHGVVKPVQ